MGAKGCGKSKFRGTMCQEIIEMFAEGKTASNFCARHSISENTLTRWLDTYPMFNDAYLVAMSKAKDYYDNIAQNYLIEEHNGAKLNTRLYELIMRNRFNMPQTRLVKMQGMAKRTAAEKLDSICEAVEKGQLTASEAQKLASLIDSTIKAQEYDELKARVEEIEKANKIGEDVDYFEDV